MKFLRPQNDMLAPDIVLDEASVSYDATRPIQRWHDRSILPNATGMTVYWWPILNDDGKLELYPDHYKNADARAPNVPPTEGSKNEHGEIYAPVVKNLDLAKVTTSPFTQALEWRAAPAPTADKGQLDRIEAKLDLLIKELTIQA